MLADSTVECRDIWRAGDQCLFAVQFCSDDFASLVPYHRLYFCASSHLRPLVLALHAVWLGLLLFAMAITARNFLSTNLRSIATTLNLSDSLAGVTLLAFGNGSTDVFSTLGALRTGSTSMAIGELMGAAQFLIGVSLASVALVGSFAVDRDTYRRDVSFLLLNMITVTIVLADGVLSLWECCSLVAIYLVYVVTICLWHRIVPVPPLVDISPISPLLIYQPAADATNDDHERIDTLRLAPPVSPSIVQAAPHEPWGLVASPTAEANRKHAHAESLYHANTPIDHHSQFIDLDSSFSISTDLRHSSGELPTEDLQARGTGGADVSGETTCVGNMTEQPLLGAPEALTYNTMRAHIDGSLSPMLRPRSAVTSVFEMPASSQLPANNSTWFKLLRAVANPVTALLYLTIPVAAPTTSEVGVDSRLTHFISTSQMILGPQFVVIIMWMNLAGEGASRRILLTLVVGALFLSTCVLTAFNLLRTHGWQPRFVPLSMSLWGFIVAIVWISSCVGEIIGVLKIFGLLTGISELLLGLTVFAFGNSLGDLVTNIAMAKLGYPVIAMSACLGCPLFNVPISIGLGGLIVLVLSGERDLKVPLGDSFIITAASLMLMLVGLLVSVPNNGWVMGRKTGLMLLVFWAVCTGCSVVVEYMGLSPF